MLKILKYISICVLLASCVASASALKKDSPQPAAQIIDQNYDEMLEMAKEMDQERTPAIYIVVISEPEVVIAKPPKATPKSKTK
tara:strand:+ start:993 stop:1244 length:252 start_codon:yes stop_codon:yes gene_type:complete